MNSTTEREYVIVTVAPCTARTCGAHGVSCCISDAPREDISLKRHFEEGCALFAREVTDLSRLTVPLSSDEARKFKTSLDALLETHTLLHMPKK